MMDAVRGRLVGFVDRIEGSNFGHERSLSGGAAAG
jgi:hypothetical protein